MRRESEQLESDGHDASDGESAEAAPEVTTEEVVRLLHRQSMTLVAAPFRRTVSGLIDCCIVFASLVVFSSVILLSDLGRLLVDMPALNWVLLYVAMSALYDLFFSLAEVDTPGIRAMGLRLSDFHGDSPSMQQRLRRLAWNSATLFGFMGLVTMWFSRDHLALPDKWSQTYFAVR